MFIHVLLYDRYGHIREADDDCVNAHTELCRLNCNCIWIFFLTDQSIFLDTVAKQNAYQSVYSYPTCADQTILSSHFVLFNLPELNFLILDVFT